MLMQITTALHVMPVTSTDSSSESETNTAEVGLPSNQGFSREQTLFLIHLMRQHLMKDHADLPKTLSELSSRVKMGRGQKKVFWQNIATKLSNHFHQKCEVEKVARKWSTLQDGYKKTKDNNASTGEGTMKCQFFKEMDELIGGNHDIDSPVVGTAMGAEIRHSVAASFSPSADAGPSHAACLSAAALSSDPESPSTSPL